MMELVVYYHIWNKECLHFYFFYIISTILTLDVPSATSNSTIECYKTFMFGEGCTKINTSTSSMVRNWCFQKYYGVQVTTFYSINATMAPYPIQRVIGDDGELWNASSFFHFNFWWNSNLRWKEIENIENLAMFFNNTFSWKDCPVECVALFCARLQAFMSTYVLSGKNIFGIMEHHVTWL